MPSRPVAPTHMNQYPRWTQPHTPMHPYAMHVRACHMHVCPCPCSKPPWPASMPPWSPLWKIKKLKKILFLIKLSYFVQLPVPYHHFDFMPATSYRFPHRTDLLHLKSPTFPHWFFLHSFGVCGPFLSKPSICFLDKTVGNGGAMTSPPPCVRCI